MRSQNDMRKVMPQASLLPALDFDEEELIWEAQRLSCDDAVSAECLDNVLDMKTNL